MSYTVVETKADLGEKLSSAGDQLVVIDFGAVWCGPCKDCEPTFKRLADKYSGEVMFLKVDVDDNDEAAAEYDISNLPTFLFIRGGQVLQRLTGFMTYDKLHEAVEAHK
ncbi:thioredoxin-T-like [Galendromus occidentalis]|uniref:Thioredoxin n=1 Tax=Galendromus occidentalis TaxID=34638 RepID=A0AAJ6VZY0_9ACAR|nr:thioredoxin-T-like [Galendromus occidentalis]